MYVFFPKVAGWFGVLAGPLGMLPQLAWLRSIRLPCSPHKSGHLPACPPPRLLGCLRWKPQADSFRCVGPVHGRQS